MTITQKILYELATKGITPKPAVLMLGPSRQTIWHKIKRCIDKGWVQEDTYLLNNHKQDFLSITVEGLIYLRDRCADDIPWASYLEIPKKVKIIGSGYSRTEIATTYSRAVMAAVMADLAGAQETVMTHQTDVDDPTSLYKIVTTAIADYNSDLTQSYMGQAVLTSRSGIEFTDGLSMKRMVEEWMHGEGRLYDIRAGRMAGMIHTQVRSYLVYVVTKDNWFTWDSKALHKEQIVFREILNRRYGGKFTSMDQIQGILLFDSAETIRTVYYSREDILAGRKPGRRFGALLDYGSGLASMIALPMTHEGARALQTLITTDTIQDRQRAIESLKEPQIYDPSVQAATSLFPLEDPFALYAVEPWLDINRVRKLRAQIKNYTDYDCRLLCNRRDEPFFQALAPDVMVWDNLDNKDETEKSMDLSVEKDAKLILSKRL